jgi:hypothetical protein
MALKINRSTVMPTNIRTRPYDLVGPSEKERYVLVLRKASVGSTDFPHFKRRRTGFVVAAVATMLSSCANVSIKKLDSATGKPADQAAEGMRFQFTSRLLLRVRFTSRPASFPLTETMS